MDFSAWPKVELHLHLDCSLSYEIVKQLRPAISEAQYRQDFIAPPKCTDLLDFISRAQRGIELMQTEEELRLVTLDLFRQLAADHVIYAEIRFAPLEHVRGGLSRDEVVRTVEAACREGIESTGVEASVILCTLRQYTEAQSMQTVQLVEQFRNTTVRGFDIAADEAGYPLDNHIAAFEFAHERGIPVTAHAGEAAGAESVWDTLEKLKTTRIGHGVRSAEDPELLDHLRDRRIHLEICPTSNVQTDAVDRLENHPADRLYRHGISLSLSTDARAIADTDLAQEYTLLAQQFGWDAAHFLQCNLEALQYAFCPAETKEKLRARLVAGFDKK